MSEKKTDKPEQVKPEEKSSEQKPTAQKTTEAKTAQQAASASTSKPARATKQAAPKRSMLPIYLVVLMVIILLGATIWYTHDMQKDFKAEFDPRLQTQLSSPERSTQDP